jgi:hypothetical protein
VTPETLRDENTVIIPLEIFLDNVDFTRRDASTDAILAQLIDDRSRGDERVEMTIKESLSDMGSLQVTDSSVIRLC